MDKRMELLNDYMISTKNNYDGNSLIYRFNEFIKKANELEEPFMAAQAYFEGLILKREDKQRRKARAETVERFEKAIELSSQYNDGANLSIKALAINQRACMMLDMLTRFVPCEIDSQAQCAFEKIAGMEIKNKEEFIQFSECFSNAMSILCENDFHTNLEIAEAISNNNLNLKDSVLPEAASFCLTAIADSLSMSSYYREADIIFQYLEQKFDPFYLATRFQHVSSLRKRLAENFSLEQAMNLEITSRELLDNVLKLNPSEDRSGVTFSDYIRTIGQPYQYKKLVEQETPKFPTSVPFKTVASLFYQSRKLVLISEEIQYILDEGESTDKKRIYGDC